MVLRGKDLEVNENYQSWDYLFYNDDISENVQIEIEPVPFSVFLSSLQMGILKFYGVCSFRNEQISNVKKEHYINM